MGHKRSVPVLYPLGVPIDMEILLLGKLLDSFFSVFSEELKDKIRYSRLNLLWNIYLNFRLMFSNVNFYGQNLEDSFLLRYLPESTGSYVDVGAGWPIRGSNSYYFYKKGWRGVTIDPIKQNMLLQRLFRPRDKHFRALLGDTPGTIDFYIFEPYEYSTSDFRIAQTILSENKVELKCINHLEIKRLDSFKLIAQPIDPTFLSIDVEGKDFEVLNSNDWKNYLPRVICIETWSNHLEDEKKINSLLQGVGYQLVAKVSLSRIYVHNEFIHKSLN